MNSYKRYMAGAATARDEHEAAFIEWARAHIGEAWAKATNRTDGIVYDGSPDNVMASVFAVHRGASDTDHVEAWARHWLHDYRSERFGADHETAMRTMESMRLRIQMADDYS